MKKTLFLFAAAAIACSASAADLATFENPASDVFNAFGGSSALQVVANPSKTALNSSDSCLLNTRPSGEGWNVQGALYNGNGDSIAITDDTRYLHFMAYSPTFAGGIGKIIVNAKVPADDADPWWGENGDYTIHFEVTSMWKDVVLDLQKAFENNPKPISAVYGIYFISSEWGGSPAGGREFYYDQIELSSSPTPRGVVTTAAVLGDFEADGVTSGFAVEDNALTVLEVAANPDKAGINASDSVLHGHTISEQGSWWGGIRVIPADVEVNDSARYLHIMIYTASTNYEFGLFSYNNPPAQAPNIYRESYTGEVSDNANINVWFDYVIDLFDFHAQDHHNLQGQTLYSIRIAHLADRAAGLDKDIYFDEIVVNADPTRRGAPSVTITGISPANPSVEKGATRQLTASVEVVGGATGEIAWTVAGAKSTTAITADGLLTVAANEAADSLTVTATSLYDPTKSASITVRIVDVYVPADLATFENPASDVFNAFGGSSALQVVANPSKTALNSSDSCLLNTRPGGEGWNVPATLYSGDGDSVLITDATRYLHFMAYSPTQAAGAGKIIVNVKIPAEDADPWWGDNGDYTIPFDITPTWKDVVLDLKSFGNAVHGIYFVSQDWGGSPAEGRTFYYDEIALTASPTPRGAVTAAATLGDFEADGVTPDFAIEGEAFSTLQVADNPDKTGINASDSVLYGYTRSTTGDWWAGLRITPTYVEVNNSNRYLHVMMYTNLTSYEFDLFSSKGEDWMGKTLDNANINVWFDHVVDLYAKDLEGKILNSFRISACVDNSANLDKNLYIDEIVVNADPTPRLPAVNISISPSNNIILAKGDTLQLTAKVTPVYGATDSGVTWLVAGFEDATTAITADSGLLTISAGETARRITVSATSTAYGSVASTVVKVGAAVSEPEMASFEASATDVFDDLDGTWSPLSIAINPDKTGLNTTDRCLLNTRTTGWTEGGQLTSALGSYAAGGSGRYLHIMVYSQDPASGHLFVRSTSQDNQWGNSEGVNDVRFDFGPVWKDVVIDLLDISVVYGLYFVSQDWGGAPSTRYFYYDEIVVNDDPTPRGETLITAPGVVGDFEDGGAMLDYSIEGSALSTIDVVSNPDKTGINATDKALYGLSSTGGESWGGARVQLGNVLISDNTRYLHVLMKTNVPHYEFDFFPMAGEGGEKYAGQDSTTNLASWFDHVVDLYDVAGEKSFENHVLIAFRVVVNVQKEENQGKDLYLDEILFSDDPTPRAPSVTINSIAPANPSVAKGATQQFTADVTATGGASDAVTWSVAGGVNMTGISAAGVLTVAAGETAATLTVTATSAYDATKSASATVTVTAASTAVEKTQSAAVLSAYPNPTAGVVYVENEAGSEVAVYSVGGELLLRAVGSAVDLSALPSGVYVVKVGAKAAKVVKK